MNEMEIHCVWPFKQSIIGRLEKILSRGGSEEVYLQKDFVGFSVD